MGDVVVDWRVGFASQVAGESAAAAVADATKKARL